MGTQTVPVGLTEHVSQLITGSRDPELLVLRSDRHKPAPWISCSHEGSGVSYGSAAAAVPGHAR